MEEFWIEIRDGSGKLLFKYNPVTNEIEIKKGGDVYNLVKLDEIRRKHGCIAPVQGQAIRPASVENALEVTR